MRTRNMIRHIPAMVESLDNRRCCSVSIVGSREGSNRNAYSSEGIEEAFLAIKGG